MDSRSSGGHWLPPLVSARDVARLSAAGSPVRRSSTRVCPGSEVSAGDRLRRIGGVETRRRAEFLFRLFRRRHCRRLTGRPPTVVSPASEFAAEDSRVTGEPFALCPSDFRSYLGKGSRGVLFKFATRRGSSLNRSFDFLCTSNLHLP